MRISKQFVREAVAAHNHSTAVRTHERQKTEQTQWDAWKAREAVKRDDLAYALRQLAAKADAQESVDKTQIDEATDKYVATDYKPSDERRRNDYSGRDARYSPTRPELQSVEDIEKRLTERGHFTALLQILDAMADDNIAVSSMREMGLLSADDVRILMRAKVTALGTPDTDES